MKVLLIITVVVHIIATCLFLNWAENLAYLNDTDRAFLALFAALMTIGVMASALTVWAQVRVGK